MTERKERGRPPHPDQLTPAEWRVVEAVRHGMSNPEIARRQGVSLDAVKYHVANALSKLGYASRKELRKWDGVRRDSALFGNAPHMIHKHADGTEEWMAFFNDNEGQPLAIMAQAKV